MTRSTDQAPATESFATQVGIAASQATKQKTLYDTDFTTWCEYQAEALRAKVKARQFYYYAIPKRSLQN